MEYVTENLGKVSKIVFTLIDFPNLYVIKSKMKKYYFEQHCKIPESLGCEFTEEDYVKIDNSYETTSKRVFCNW